MPTTSINPLSSVLEASFLEMEDPAKIGLLTRCIEAYWEERHVAPSTAPAAALLPSERESGFVPSEAEFCAAAMLLVIEDGYGLSSITQIAENRVWFHNARVEGIEIWEIAQFLEQSGRI